MHGTGRETARMLPKPKIRFTSPTSLVQHDLNLPITFLRTVLLSLDSFALSRKIINCKRPRIPAGHMHG